MKAFDRLLQQWRIRTIEPHIPSGSKILDIGCDDGALFSFLDSKIAESIGCDPNLNEGKLIGRHMLVPGAFPEAISNGNTFQAITMLAVLEHIPETEQENLANNCFKFLDPKGKLLITVPSPIVDKILPVLVRLKVADGMSLDEHYGFHPSQTREIFEAVGFSFQSHIQFQLGMNNFFIFEKPCDAS